MPCLEHAEAIKLFRLEEERQNLTFRLGKKNLSEEQRAVLERQLKFVTEELAHLAGSSSNFPAESRLSRT